MRIGGRSVVGSESNVAALSPFDIRWSRAKRPDLITDSLVVLITAFLLIDVDSELRLTGCTRRRKKARLRFV
jgi:hypothetical protein